MYDAAAGTGADTASRMKIMIPTAGLTGTNTIYILYKNANGVVVLLTTFTVEVDPALSTPEHKHVPGDAATCTTEQICTECGEVLVEALGHDVVLHAGQPACVDIGWDAYETCTRCDYSTYQEKSPEGHKYFEFIVLPEPLVNFVVENSANYPFEVNGKEITSTNKDNNSTSTYTITAMRDFELKLRYRVSSEKGFDYLIIALNGVEIVKVSGSINWTDLCIDVKEGDKVTITYEKDQSKWNNDDCAYVMIETDESTNVIQQPVVITKDQLANLQPLCGQDIVCEACKAVLAEKLGHNFVDGECTNCGQVYRDASVFHVPASDMAPSIPGSPGINSATLSADGTYVTIDSIGNGDPFYQLPMLNQKGYVVQYVAIKYRSTSTFTISEMFVGSGAGPTGQGDNIRFELICDGEWQLAIIDLSQASAVVDGIVNYLRWDPFASNADATIDLAYIAGFETEADAFAFDAYYS